VPSAAAHPTLALARGDWRSQRIGGGGLSFGDFSLTTQRKVTRPSPKGGRNPVEGHALASCTAPAVPSASAPSSPTLLPQGEKGAKTISETGPSPARGEGCRDDLGNRPFPREGRREQRRPRKQAPLPPWEKKAKTIAGMIPSPVGRGLG
jgi:hypothetical protein